MKLLYTYKQNFILITIIKSALKMFLLLYICLFYIKEYFFKNFDLTINKFKEDGFEILVDSKCIENLSHISNYRSQLTTQGIPKNFRPSINELRPIPGFVNLLRQNSSDDFLDVLRSSVIAKVRNYVCVDCNSIVNNAVVVEARTRETKDWLTCDE